ncbi:dTDP-4-dehydrorhamnose 3,5-epimerase [Paenibacillus chungangensis]|uniref:dTDP-4-dehydrorhamnose 3,5-epimerase n=1 Tax=Paenibacillus chungangensis TaxID=696535 RepID=A0ABW3HWD6_9BACL
MKLQETSLPGVMLIEPKVYSDHRGFFMESYNFEQFAEHGVNTSFMQDNHSLSKDVHVLRGLHYQLHPKAQCKLVRVTAGEIMDVVLDMRRGSPTYGQWASFVLSADNKLQLYVPAGFAHGFCTLVPNTQVQYKVDAPYSPQHDRGIRWDDPALSIPWPTSSPILSEKDKHHPTLAEAELNFDYGEGE